MAGFFLLNDEECLDHHRRRDDVVFRCGTPPLFVSLIGAGPIMTGRLFIRTRSPSSVTAPFPLAVAPSPLTAPLHAAVAPPPPDALPHTAATPSSPTAALPLDVAQPLPAAHPSPRAAPSLPAAPPACAAPHRGRDGADDGVAGDGSASARVSVGLLRGPGKAEWTGDRRG